MLHKLGERGRDFRVISGNTTLIKKSLYPRQSQETERSQSKRALERILTLSGKILGWPETRRWKKCDGLLKMTFMGP